MSSKPSIPDYAHRILVPVSNPETAPKFLRLAASLSHPEDGKVIALKVSVGDTETEAQSTKELKPIVDEMKEEGHNIDLVTTRAVSPARGILDEVRELNADLLILGVQRPKRGEVVIGTVAENVARTAPCDVLIYRAGEGTFDYKRVAVWANGSEAAQVAASVSLLIANARDVKAEAMYVQMGNNSYWQCLARVEQTLGDIPGNDKFKRSVIQAQDLVGGLVSRIEKDDLFVVGFSRRSNLELWLFGDFAQELLNRAPGPVILTARAAGKDLAPEQRVRQRFRTITPTLTKTEQEEMVLNADESSDFDTDYVMLIMISILIATFGLLLNSAAVIIGAMLVAPLMSPIVAFSTGMITGRLDLLRKSFLTLAGGVLMALGTSMAVGMLIPSDTATPEMLSRGAPGILDAGVAFVSGLVGAYATARRGIPAALAGVAIAAALMPPLGTVGLGIAFGESDLAEGAFLLFITNIIYIAIAGALIFFWLGMRPLKNENIGMNRQLVSAVVLLGLVMPIILFFRNVSDDAVNSARIADDLDQQFPSGEVMEVEIEMGSPIEVTATIRLPRSPSRSQVLEAQRSLSDDLDEPVRLNVIVERMVTPNEASNPNDGDTDE